MKTIIKYILLTAMRDKLFIVLLGCMVAAVLISSSLAGTALIEEQEMALVFSAAVMRLILAVGIIVFIAFHVRHVFDTKEIDVMLSRPLSRHELVFSYWTGFAVISVFLVLIATILLAVTSPINHVGFINWGVSLLLEVWLLAAVALFASFILQSSVVSVMVGLGIYILSRMMGFFLHTIQSHGNFDSKMLNFLSKEVIDKISIIIPRLDFFAESDWLVYGVANVYETAGLYLMQSAIFIPLLLLASIVDFRKRDF